jgi:hypothetical protein
MESPTLPPTAETIQSTRDGKAAGKPNAPRAPLTRRQAAGTAPLPAFHAISMEVLGCVYSQRRQGAD